MVIVVHKITVFTVFLDQIIAALLSKREILKKTTYSKVLNTIDNILYNIDRESKSTNNFNTTLAPKCLMFSSAYLVLFWHPRFPL